ncbi:MAG: hypothetical protein QOI19_763 [Thermoleophilaceae bacterium]|nr:hypothetical protein [Thermoleophilaceae bacterium]
MKRFNLHSAETELEGDEPAGFKSRGNRFGKEIGAAMIGGTVYDIDAGEAICPYHFEYGDEEWLIVLTGNPTVRTPDAETTLEPGDVICFPAGPEGAHKVTGPARVLMISTLNEPSVAAYPDSDKLGVFVGDLRLMVKRDSGVDYWLGET